MTKRLLAIYLILIVLLAAFIPSCTPATPTTGTIEVKATLDGSPWPSSGTGVVSYTLTPASGSLVNGTKVPDSFSVDAGNWTCAYVSDGPVGAYLESITPLETQEVSADGTITFTLNFKTTPSLDASITFLSWTIDGTQVPDGQYTVPSGTIIDVEYDSYVAGNPNEWVTVNHTFWFRFHFKGAADFKTLHVSNGPVLTTPPVQNMSHQCSVEGIIRPVCYTFDVLKCEPVLLDVVASWKQKKGTHYNVRINWIGIHACPGILADSEEPTFDLQDPGGSGNFTGVTWACISVDGDTNPANDCCGNSTMLYIEYEPAGP
jgi:hypothetical protein